MDFKHRIRTIPHYPKPGVTFRDITTLLLDPHGFRETIAALGARYQDSQIGKVAAVESRGFIIGAALAFELRAGFVPIRKRGKLPSATVGLDYELEYGVDRVEMHVDAIGAGERVLLVDDLIATGGTAAASCRLLRGAKADLVGACFVVDLPDLGGAQRLRGDGVDVFALCQFEGD